MTLSARAQRLLSEPSPLVVAHFEAVADPYHPVRNPTGYVNLGTAQNHLLWDLLEPVLCAPRPMVASDVHYHPLYGTASLREAVARFLGRVHDTAIDPEDLVVVSGVSAALDILAYALCDPGDGIAVPVPYYNGLDADYTGRSACRVVPVRSSSADGFALHVDSLEAAVRSAGVRVRAVTLVSPNNPLGTVYSAETLAEVARFAAHHGLALITDEIYTCSVFGDTAFSSALTLPGDILPPEQVHTAWGFGKDFALSGLRVGVLHTRHPGVRAAARELAYLATVSTDTQALLCRLLNDPEWTDGLLAENRKRLAESYQMTSELLRGKGITHIDAEAGLFVWMDLRQWLAEATAEAEHALWQTIFRQGRVSISPGTVFHCEEPGWFRLCHAVGETDLREGITRIGKTLRSAGHA
jgi:aspartate/methionine/tyrosine aminotransferase